MVAAKICSVPFGVGLAYFSMVLACQAQVQFGGNSDVAGITIGMPMQAAKAAAMSGVNSREEIPILAKLNSGYQRVEWDIGSVIVVERLVRRAHYHASGEFISLVRAPNEDALIGITRYKGYKDGEFPTKSSVITALVNKYGNPSEYRGDEGVILNWVAKASLSKDTFGLVYAKNSGCTIERSPFYDAEFLYEYGNALYQNNFPSEDINRDVSSGGSDKFLDVFNSITKNTNTYKNCGTVLQVVIKLSDDKDFVVSVRQHMTDFDLANKHLSRLAAEFWRKEGELRQKALTAPGSNSPGKF